MPKQVSLVFEAQRQKSSCFVQAENGALTFIYWNGTEYVKDAASFQGTNATGQISTVFEVQRNHCGLFFRNQDGHLAYYYVLDGQWKLDAESFKGAGVLAKDASISAVFEPQRNHSAVFCNGEDGHVHYFYLNTSNSMWAHDATFANVCKVAGEVSAVFETQRNHSAVFFKGDDNFLHYFYLQGDAWKHDGEFSKVFVGPIGNQVSAIYEPQRKHSAVFVVSQQDAHLHYLYLGNSTSADVPQQWAHDGESFKQAGTVAGDIAATFETSRNHCAVCLVSNDGYIKYFGVPNQVWTMNAASLTHAKVTTNVDMAASENGSDLLFVGQDDALHFYHVAKNASWWKYDAKAFN